MANPISCPSWLLVGPWPSALTPLSLGAPICKRKRASALQAGPETWKEMFTRCPGGWL